MKIFKYFIYITLYLGAISSVQAQVTVEITRAECDRLAIHTPSADVAYTPGVDVNGNAVAPADLNAQPQITVPDKITIPVDVNLATSLGITNTFDGEAKVGNVEVHRDGRIFFNGQPVGGDAQHELARRCQRITR
ncbi:MAG: hypothetical protein JJ899_10190 [Alphaproteobacteria bacterium]|nr:hypothetical protein [Alphaproteobacteria bacterium]